MMTIHNPKLVPSKQWIMSPQWWFLGRQLARVCGNMMQAKLEMLYH